MKLFKSIFTFFILIFVLSVHAQYTVQHFTIKDGLVSNEIGSISEDSLGFIWFQNGGRICRFDGSTFEYFADSSAVIGLDNLSNQERLSISNRGISVVSEKKLKMYSNGKFAYYNLPDSIEISGHSLLNDKFDKYGRFVYESDAGKGVLTPWGYFGLNIILKNVESAEIFLNENNEITIYSDDTIYVIKEDLRIVKFPCPIKSDVLVYPQILDELIFWYDYQEEILHLTSKGDYKKLSIPQPQLISQVIFARPKARMSESGFIIYYGGFLITEKRIYEDPQIRNIPSYHIISETEVLFYDKSVGLILKNFEENKSYFIDGLPSGDYAMNFFDLSTGDICIASSTGLYVLNKQKSFTPFNKQSELVYHFPEYTGDRIYCDYKGNYFYRVFHDSSYSNIVFNIDGFGFDQVSEVIVQFNNQFSKYQQFTDILNSDQDRPILKSKNEIGYMYLDSVPRIMKIPELSYVDGLFELSDSFMLRSKGKEFEFHFIDRNFEKVSKSVFLNYWTGIGGFVFQDSLLISQNPFTNKQMLIRHNLKQTSVDSILFLENEFEQRFFQTNLNDSHGRLWLINKANDLVSVNLESKEILRYPGILIGVPQYHVALIDENDFLWVSTSNGINIIDLNNLSRSVVLRPKEIYPSEISAFVEDSNHNLFVISNTGIFWTNSKKALSEKVEFKTLFKSSNYDVVYYSAKLLEGGDLIVSNEYTGQFCQIPADFEKKLDTVPPKLCLKFFKCNNEYIYGAFPEFSKLDLSSLSNEFRSDQNDMCFEFSALEYRDKRNLQFRYKLTNYSQDWKYIQNPSVELMEMAYGTYFLEFQSVYNNIPSVSFEYKFTILPPWYHTWWARVSFVIFGLLVVFLFVRRRTATLRARQKQLEKTVEERTFELQKEKELVEEKHKEITDSINYAERIQRSFLATKSLLDENLKEYFVLFQPKDVVSGDFYWATKLQNNQFALVTADSTGHGVPGAIMSILNITCLEKAVQEEKLVEPGEILNHARLNIIDRLKKDGSAEGGKDGMDASLVCFDFENKKLIYAAANNPVWIVRATPPSPVEMGAGGEVGGAFILEFAPDKMPVGKHDRQHVPFTSNQVDLKTGDVVYTLTDGMPDQFGGEKGKKFMYKKLKELLISIASDPMEMQKEKLNLAFFDWKGDLEQVDDVCVIGVRI